MARRCATWITAKLSRRSPRPPSSSPGVTIPATTPEAGEFVHSRIPRASLAMIDAAHLSNIEQPHDYADRVLGFLLQK